MFILKKFLNFFKCISTNEITDENFYGWNCSTSSIINKEILKNPLLTTEEDEQFKKEIEVEILKRSDYKIFTEYELFKEYLIENNIITYNLYINYDTKEKALIQHLSCAEFHIRAHFNNWGKD